MTALPHPRALGTRRTRTVDDLGAEHLALLARPGLATLAVPRPGGGVHATPVKAVLDVRRSTAWVFVEAASVKARLVTAADDAGAPLRVALTEVSDRAWVSLEGAARLLAAGDCPPRVRTRYLRRFGRPVTWGDAVLEVDVDRVLHGR